MDFHISEIRRKHNFKPSRSLGQNFLADGNIIRKIVENAGVGKGDLVLEIGPGTGAMTEELAKKAGHVVAVEIDKKLMPILEERFSGVNNVSFINGDVLKTDISALLSSGRENWKEESGPSAIKVVANLPYYITTPIIMKLLEDSQGISLMMFMVQKEVADRILSGPGTKDYGALSVAVQFYSRPSRVMNVPPECFIPRPDVHSTVIKLEIYENPPVYVKNKELFFKVVKAAFGQRRKTLLNSLYNSGCFNADREKIRKVLEECGIDERRRGETLSIMQFAQIANSFSGEDC